MFHISFFDIKNVFRGNIKHDIRLFEYDILHLAYILCPVNTDLTKCFYSMKKFFQSTLLCAVMLVCFGCKEDASVHSIKGAYRYKASGIVSVTDPSASVRSHTLTETGILELVSLHDGNDLLLTFNQSGGGVCTARGTASEKALHIDPFTRTMTVDLETYSVDVSARGEVFDNTIIIYLSISGKSTSSDKTLQGTDIQMLAQKN